MTKAFQIADNVIFYGIYFKNNFVVLENVLKYTYTVKSSVIQSKKK